MDIFRQGLRACELPLAARHLGAVRDVEAAVDELKEDFRLKDMSVDNLELLGQAIEDGFREWLDLVRQRDAILRDPKPETEEQLERVLKAIEDHEAQPLPMSAKPECCTPPRGFAALGARVATPSGAYWQ